MRPRTGPTPTTISAGCSPTTNAGNAALSETFTYSTTGNLLTRTRLTGAFTYPAGAGVRPHAPLTLGNRNFTYTAKARTTYVGQGGHITAEVTGVTMGQGLFADCLGSRC